LAVLADAGSRSAAAVAAGALAAAGGSRSAAVLAAAAVVFGDKRYSPGRVLPARVFDSVTIP